MLCGFIKASFMWLTGRQLRGNVMKLHVQLFCCREKKNQELLYRLCCIYGQNTSKETKRCHTSKLVTIIFCRVNVFWNCWKAAWKDLGVKNLGACPKTKFAQSWVEKIIFSYIFLLKTLESINRKQNITLLQGLRYQVSS